MPGGKDWTGAAKQFVIWVRDNCALVEPMDLKRGAIAGIAPQVVDKWPAFWKEPLNVLTKAYQVAPESIHDAFYLAMSIWPHFWMDRGRDIANIRAERHSSANGHKPDLTDEEWALISANQDEWLRTFAAIDRVCGLVRRVMDTLYHQDSITESDLVELNTILVSCSDYFQVIPNYDQVMPAAVVEMDSNTEIRMVQSVALIGHQNTEWPFYLLATNLRDLIIKHIGPDATHDAVFECKECRSIAVKARNGMKYCSHRCSHRAGQRIRKVRVFP